MMKKNGFALIEVLISVTILSTVTLSVMSGVLTCIYVISENSNYTRAMLIARSKMNEFIESKMRGLDIANEPIPEYPNFYFNRKTTLQELSFLPFPVRKTEIKISWKSERNKNPYTIFYVFTEQ